MASNLKDANALKKIKSDNPDIMKLQDNIIGHLKNNIQTTIIPGIKVATGSNRIEHKQGKTPSGYVVVNRSASIDIYCISMDDKAITLNCSAPGTISIQVVA